MWEGFRYGRYQKKWELSEKLREVKAAIGSKIVCILLILIVLASVVQYGRLKCLEWKQTRSGVPDVVSSMSINNDYYLKVAANSAKIDDKKEFARRIIHMCLDNSFHSIRFSTDINGYPSELNITVYLSRKAAEEGEPVCEIEFSTKSFDEENDIKNDLDKYHLYLDKEEIEFY